MKHSVKGWTGRSRVLWCLLFVVLFVPCLFFGCGGELPGSEGTDRGSSGKLEILGEHNHKHDTTPPPTFVGLDLTVGDAVRGYCSTAVVKGLSEQLIQELNCIRPNTMASLRDLRGLNLGSAVMPYMQKPAVDALKRALRARGVTMFMNSALRTLPQQFLLYRWFLLRRCGISLAAPPGSSNHESGLAIDISHYSSWRNTLGNSGFRWLGGNDPVHFDYVRGGIDIRGLSVRAFQRLWNRNHPNDRIAEDGSYGSNTASRLLRAPASGFAIGPSCSSQERPPEPSKLALEVYWARQSDGSYNLRALGPAQVSRVKYFVDGFEIGKSSREDGENFPTSYKFFVEKLERKLEVKGYDASGKEIASGVGLLDVTESVGVYIKQMGASLYEVGLERAPSSVAYIQVTVDGISLKDSVEDSEQSRRKAVRAKFSRLGQRRFEIRTFNNDGSLRGTLRRTFSLR